MELSSLPSLNSLSIGSNFSSGIHFFEDIFFWERLKFDWVSNLNSFNDFAFTFLDDDPDVLMMAHSDINILKHLLCHWKDLANRHSDIEKLTAAEYKFIYYDSLKCSSNMWEFLQLEFMKTQQDAELPCLHNKYNLKRCESYQLEHSGMKLDPCSILRRHRHSCDLSEKFKSKLHFEHCIMDFNRKSDHITLDFIDFFSSLNQNLALYLLIEGPKTIPPQFRNIYKNLIQILCKTHSSFLPTMMQMKKNDRLRPIEYEGLWESDATCSICYETHGAFVKRCCDMVVCEQCYTQYLNYQVSNLGRIHVECPSTNCHKPIKFQSIWIRLSAKVFLLVVLLSTFASFITAQNDKTETKGSKIIINKSSFKSTYYNRWCPGNYYCLSTQTCCSPDGCCPHGYPVCCTTYCCKSGYYCCGYRRCCRH